MDIEEKLKIKAGTLVTVEMLEELVACQSELMEFERLWPNGLSLRLKNLKLAEAEGNHQYRCWMRNQSYSL